MKPLGQRSSDSDLNTGLAKVTKFSSQLGRKRVDSNRNSEVK